MMAVIRSQGWTLFALPPRAVGDSMLVEVLGLDCDPVEDGLDDVDVAGRENP